MPSISWCLRQAAGRLAAGFHPDRARPDAELLLMHFLGRSRAWLIAHPDDEIEFSRWETFYEFAQRRAYGEPIQYMIGEAEFYGLPFRVNADVLIPRPETEHLVEKVIDIARPFARPRIIDIGTGSGAIAIALAHQLPAAEITATDLSEPALALARENAARNGVESRVRFLPGDLLSPVTGELFDIVASNPPYVPNTDRALIAVEVRDYEPALALFAGDDGLDVYRRLIPAADAALVPGGFIALEIGFTQAEAIERLLASSGFRHIEFTPDLQGIPRVASAQRP